MEFFVNDNIKCPALKIESGLFEPVHLLQKEADLLTKGITETLIKNSDEIS